jgi:hypothetical protein
MTAEPWCPTPYDDDVLEGGDPDSSPWDSDETPEWLTAGSPPSSAPTDAAVPGALATTPNIDRPSHPTIPGSVRGADRSEV